MRKKKNLIPRLEVVKHLFLPAGRVDIESRPLFVELGCGMGHFTSGMAVRHPDALMVGVERVADALVVAMEKAHLAGVPNVRFIRGDAAMLEEWFAPRSIDRLFINFCDPWPPKNQHKRRLTHRNFLSVYQKLLVPNGRLAFKTDNDDLFEFSCRELTECGWELTYISRDLHAESNPPEDDVMTEYERRWMEKGFAIRRLEARWESGADAQSKDLDYPILR